LKTVFALKSSYVKRTICTLRLIYTFDFALSLPVYKTNNRFLLPKMNQLNVKSCPEIGHVNKLLVVTYVENKAKVSKNTDSEKSTLF
jgi:hypothetical protein